MFIEGNWSRFVRLTLNKKIGSVFMEIFERKVSLKLKFCHPAAVPCCGSGKAALCQRIFWHIPKIWQLFGICEKKPKFWYKPKTFVM